MSTPALTADALTPHRKQQPPAAAAHSPVRRLLSIVPTPTTRRSAESASEPAARRSAEPVPSRVAPVRRRIQGATTEPMPVRGCSGEALGRTAHQHGATAPNGLRRTTEPSGLRGTTEPSGLRHVTPSAREVTDGEPVALRLTRRGRMLVTTLSVLVFGAAIVVLGLRVSGVLEPGPRFTHTVPVQVAPGQSLWSIAQDTNPGQDPTAVVEKIANLNNLHTPADITPGQTLQIPVAG
ncbi:LysM peptidoglycan-binding domain-containing protein [Kribbella solani]|uniref:LysM peptidoglycan-binding domain-containing protein n=1 Tax=Kribbella solani TaxID=236067 RepID=UPI0029A89EE3|nr:LysM peptidoglycan-binding domain-containing protein [Kribbella solani]MDX2973320.1 LysM peptidoglycan-binding domain-containing protein [Kribbella solani]